MNLPVFDCLINENVNDESGIYAISFVDAPANEVEFITLSAQQAKEEFLCRDTQKQILTGVVLRPGQLIYRRDERLGEYYIRFSEVEIEKIARKMMKTGIALHNTTHQHQEVLTGNYLSELWIVEEPGNDKSRALGFDPQPKGTLMCSYKIDDKDYWNTQVMAGHVKGFSLEGFFFQQAVKEGIMNSSIINQTKNEQMNKEQNKKNESLWSKLTRFFLDIETVGKSDATGSGTAYVIFVLADGKEALIDADGFATIDGEQLPAGEHLLADGNILVVDGEGQFTETKEGAQQATTTDQAVAPQTLSEEAETIPADSPSESDPAKYLKAKIAELENKLAELAGIAQEANAEVQKLRKTTPSVLPATASGNRDFSELKRHEQMACALRSAVKSSKAQVL
ncbi:XkdF-like putative serine protease domain-containing protein [Viscerimonas tarda]